MNTAKTLMKVSKLATKLKVSPDTVRYYTRVGIIKPKRNRNNGFKEYDEQDQRRLRFVITARQLGFTVEDIKQILGESDKGSSPCPLVRRIIDQRLFETRQRFEETLALRSRMEEAARQWGDLPDREPTGHMICHLIENFVTEK
jgi:DNA-binding transcriptional MerR regulator